MKFLFQSESCRYLYYILGSSFLGCFDIHRRIRCLGVRLWYPVTSTVVVNVKLHTCRQSFLTESPQGKCCQAHVHYPMLNNYSFYYSTEARNVQHPLGAHCFWGITHTIPLGRVLSSASYLVVLEAMRACSRCIAPVHCSLVHAPHPGEAHGVCFRAGQQVTFKEPVDTRSYGQGWKSNEGLLQLLRNNSRHAPFCLSCPVESEFSLVPTSQTLTEP